MNELETGFDALSINRLINPIDKDIPNEIPFCPSGNLATKLQDTPRYLFRVFSKNSAGENSSEWMKSVDAQKGNFTDIFKRDNASAVALTLNEHLMPWPKLNGDPFISWTTSLLFAIQYAIFKYKKEHVELNMIYLCIVDTTQFPSGVFIKDLDLIEEFQDKVTDDHVIWYKNKRRYWKNIGLSNIRQLRNRKHEEYSGIYYFGEYLSQGQTKINGRSCTVPCDKVINNHLFAMMPNFKVEMESEAQLWAKAVIKFREPSPSKIMEQEAIDNSEFFEAKAIALEFGTKWFLPMLANLLALSPRTANPANIRLISKLFSNGVEHSLLSKITNVVADDNIPEVLRFREIVHAINKDYHADRAAVLVRSMEETADIVRHFIRDSETTESQNTLGTGNLAGCPPTVDHDHVQTLKRSLETLSIIIQEFQEATS
ncbi:uncharacterized protein TrAFT101_010946 [Trichoderma asperellum]|uniref:uncharacterized protein n=1 Tax=Trichoderma asperellum TaxID=101201 RepID=UPI003323DC0E|nr:hypothetical protein TrAFT101_010946 [Trichoderma asperellum]